MEQNPVQTPTPSINVPPVNNTPQSVAPIKLSSAKLVAFMFILIILLLGTTVFFFYQNSQLKKQVALFPTPSPIALETPDPTADWKTYSGKEFDLKYPTGWVVNERFNDKSAGDFSGNIVEIKNSTRSIHIELLPFPSTYGFRGDTKVEKQPITFMFDEKEYSATENIIEDGRAFVDKEVGVNGKKYFVMFGTGYPAGSEKVSLSEYQSEKSTILQILSTFKFTD